MRNEEEDNMLQNDPLNRDMSNYNIINWTRISMKNKQDSRNYFESLVFYSKTMKIRN